MRINVVHDTEEIRFLNGLVRRPKTTNKPNVQKASKALSIRRVGTKETLRRLFSAYV